MRLEDFIATLKQWGKPDYVLQSARELLPPYLEAAGGAADLLGFTRSYVEAHRGSEADITNLIIILYWYHTQSGNRDCAQYLITLLGTRGVIASQAERVRELYGEETAGRIFAELDFPPLGADLAAYPQAVERYLRRMRANLSEQQCQKALAGDHHGIGTGQFSEDKRRFAEHPDLEAFLRQKHQEFARTLAEHARSGAIWFEQYISQDVADYVAARQVIHTGVLEGDRVIVQKIAYDPDAWLKERDPTLKRFHACHCPFVRFAVREGRELPSLWCHCSGGFTKLPFDCLFDADLEVELLESVLTGADKCSFAIKLPEGWRQTGDSV